MTLTVRGSVRGLTALAMAIVVSGAMLFAQADARFTGTVLDQSGATVAGATVVVKDEKTGAIAKWAFELNSPNYLMRSGWTKNSLKLDDVVTVVGALARDGTKQVNASTVKLAESGKTLFAGSSDPNAPR